jgi:hypothetical protein
MSLAVSLVDIKLREVGWWPKKSPRRGSQNMRLNHISTESDRPWVHLGPGGKRIGMCIHKPGSLTKCIEPVFISDQKCDFFLINKAIFLHWHTKYPTLGRHNTSPKQVKLRLVNTFPIQSGRGLHQ